MSVPVWGVTLSGPLRVVGLVRRYRTNYLMGRSLLLRPRKFLECLLSSSNVCGISNPFGLLSPVEGQISYVLLTRSPLDVAIPFDLHVLSTPPAFILSQDQTLHCYRSRLYPLLGWGCVYRRTGYSPSPASFCCFACHYAVVKVFAHSLIALFVRDGISIPYLYPL